MKTEEATRKVAPSPTQISNPLYNVKGGVIEDSPHTGITSSTLSIESPQTQSLYITPRSEKPQKEHTEAYYKKQVELFAGIDPRLTFFDAVVIAQLVSWVRQKDGFMICGAEKLGNYFGQSKQSALLSLSRLEKFGYLNCLQRGKGRGIASKYQLGELYSRERRGWIKEQLLANEEKAKPLNFERTEPKGKPRGKPPTKWEKVQKSIPFNNTDKVQKSISKRHKNLYPHPIGQPIDTHTKESLWAFNKESWAKECQRLNPSRDLKDIERTFPLAIRRGAKDGDWMHWVEYFDSFYTPSTAPARSSPAPRPAVKSSCESPKQARLDYNDPKILEEVLFVALSNGETPAFILASVKDPALAQSVLAKAEARIETSRNRLRMP